MTWGDIPPLPKGLVVGAWGCFLVGAVLGGASSVVFGLGMLVGGLLLLGATLAGLPAVRPPGIARRIMWAVLLTAVVLFVGGGVAVLVASAG